MAKFYGNIGYASEVVTAPGVVQTVYTVRKYKGDLIQNRRKLRDTSDVNTGITVSNEISIVADPYAREHFHEIRWAEYRNSKWTVSDVTVGYPRLILTLGGPYHG